MRARMVVWRGLSRLDNVTPIVVLATYDTRATGTGSSANRKTGNMIQTWILRDDMSPLDAVRLGHDEAICGCCPHRSTASGGSGACYVNVGQAPRSTWAAYRRNGVWSKQNRTGSRPFDVDAFRGRLVRIGSYGDPAAAPFEIWEAIATAASGVTGYTHAWRTADTRFARHLMASADSIADGVQARRQGYRSFIVRAAGTPKPRGAVVCPASAEAGKRTVCASCLQCGGTASGRRADITIVAHGSGASRFGKLPLAVVS